MQLSIRNRLDATVESVTSGPAMANVRTRLADGQDITAAITNEAVTDLNLQPGQSVQLLVKSTEVAVAIEPIGVVSIRNRLAGTVAAVDHGEVMTTVRIDIPDGLALVAAITRESAEDLRLDIGLAVTAPVKATDVAIAIPLDKSRWDQSLD